MQASLSSPHPHFESDLNTRPECSCTHLSIHPSVHPSISSFIHALFSPLPSSILLPPNAWYVSFSVYTVIEYQRFCWCVFLNYIFHSISFSSALCFEDLALLLYFCLDYCFYLLCGVRPIYFTHLVLEQWNSQLPQTTPYTYEKFSGIQIQVQN